MNVAFATTVAVLPSILATASQRASIVAVARQTPHLPRLCPREAFCYFPALPAKGANMSLEIGDKAPDFTLPTDGDGKIKLSDLKGQKVVLYFYPKDDTPGCTKEACAFGEMFPRFKKMDATVIGISRDSVASHDKFKKKYKLPFTLASDSEGKVTEKYGVWVEKSLYGRKYMGIERATFLIDEKGKIEQVWHKVKVPGHADEVMKAVSGN
jgi:thioredoxin-dependent peroxiredoxin